MIDKESKIIWSADVSDEQTLIGLLDRMPRLRIVKVDRLLFTITGLDIIRRLNDRGLKVFADAKIVEIPSKTLEIAKLHLAYKPFMLNCMAGVISTGHLTQENTEKIDGLKRFADACLQVGTKPCGVTVLTSKEPNIVAEEFNGRNSIEQVLYYVEWLQKCGFTDIVCSPEEVPAIRKESRFDSLDLNTPGIRPLGSAKDDQARSNTPEAALAAGATRLVIGRPITNGDPAENLEKILLSIK